MSRRRATLLALLLAAATAACSDPIAPEPAQDDECPVYTGSNKC